MPAITEKKGSGLTQEPETKLSQEYYTPETDPIQEPSPEEAPEDLSMAEFEVTRITSLPLCPVCDSTVYEITEGSLDPQDSIDYLECSCGWTDRKFFGEMTTEEVLSNLEEVPF